MDRFVIGNATIWIGDGTSYEGHIVVRDKWIEAIRKLHTSSGQVETWILSAKSDCQIQPDATNSAQETNYNRSEVPPEN